MIPSSAWRGSWRKCSPTRTSTARPHPTIAMIARAQKNRADREASSVWSTVERCLTLFHDPVIGGNLSAHELPFDTIHDPAHPVSLYLVCNPGDGPRLEPLFKLLIQQIMARVTSGSPRARGPQALALFEEFPALGYMPFFAKVLGLMRSYRMRALIAIQSLNSLEQLYGERQTILDNCQVKVFLAVGDDRTAKRISDMLSTTTVEREVQSTSRQAGSLLSNQSWAPHETARPLLTVGELIQFPERSGDRAGERDAADCGGEAALFRGSPVDAEGLMMRRLRACSAVGTGKIVFYSLCFVMGIAVVLLSMAVMAVSVVRLVLAAHVERRCLCDDGGGSGCWGWGCSWGLCWCQRAADDSRSNLSDSMGVEATASLGAGACGGTRREGTRREELLMRQRVWKDHRHTGGDGTAHPGPVGRCRGSGFR